MGGEKAVETAATEPVAPGEAREIVEGIWRIAHPVGFPPGSQNAYVLADDGAAGPAWTIVDPGLRGTEARWRALLDGPLAGRPVRRVIATHHHPDHIGAAGWFQRTFGAALWTTRTAWLFARMMRLDAWEEPPEEMVRFYVRAGFDAAQMARWRERAKRNFSVTIGEMPLGFRHVAEGEAVAIGARRWRALIGGGHAPDHLMLHDAASGLLISGDQILPDISPNIGVYPTEPEADPLGDWLAACRRFADLFADADDLLTLPGHGAAFFGPAPRLTRLIARHRAALDRLEALLETPKTAAECWPALYRRKIEGDLEGLAIVETLSHLNRLIAEERATRRPGEGGVDLYQRV